eukprot:82601-Alexandrium_andersonii.AAC.1
MGHVRRGPICKHAGAVLYALAAESHDKAKQFPALPASRTVLSPKGSACSADGRGACEPPASRAPGSTPGGLGALRLSLIHI